MSGAIHVTSIVGRIATDLGTVAVEDLDLVGQRAGVTGHVALVGVLGDQSERPPLATTPDQDPGPAGPDRPGKVAGVVRVVKWAPCEAHVVAGEHGPAHLDRLLQHVQTDPSPG